MKLPDAICSTILYKIGVGDMGFQCSVPSRLLGKKKTKESLYKAYRK
jgi:hypothetical protein